MTDTYPGEIGPWPAFELRETEMRPAKRPRPRYQIPDRQNGTGEANVVNGPALAARINQFCARWLAERPQTGKWETGATFYGPIGWLAEKANCPPRQIQRIRHGHTLHVNMSRADAILQAIGEGDRLEDDLEPYPNPRWSIERWRAYMAERGCV